MTIADTFRL